VLNVDIRRPRAEDIKELYHFFRTVITDTFIKEGIGDKSQVIEDEIEAKKTYLESDFVSGGKKRHFLIALDEGKILVQSNTVQQVIS
jgi:hypothetical protein